MKVSAVKSSSESIPLSCDLRNLVWPHVSPGMDGFTELHDMNENNPFPFTIQAPRNRAHGVVFVPSQISSIS
jgi:hypothetical protein